VLCCLHKEIQGMTLNQSDFCCCLCFDGGGGGGLKLKKLDLLGKQGVEDTVWLVVMMMMIVERGLTTHAHSYLFIGGILFT